MRDFREAEDNFEHVAENSRCPSEADIYVSCLVQYKGWPQRASSTRSCWGVLTLIEYVSRMGNFAYQWARGYLTWASKKTCDVKLVLYMRSGSG